MDSTDLRGEIKTLVSEVRGLTAAQKKSGDNVQFKHLFGGLGVALGLLVTVVLYVLASVDEKAKAPTAVFDKRLTAAETSIVDVQHQIGKATEESRDEFKRVRTEAQDIKTSADRRFDRTDEKLERVLDAVRGLAVPPPPPTTIHRRP